jgi:hypothetical protein
MLKLEDSIPFITHSLLNFPPNIFDNNFEEDTINPDEFKADSTENPNDFEPDVVKSESFVINYMGDIENILKTSKLVPV